MAKVADELIRPILRALDDVPVHGRQLGDMVRRLRTTQRTNRDGVNDVDRFEVTLRPFKRNRKHDPAEYDRQYNEQMTTLQNMSVADWRRNRQEYLANGRTSDSVRAQRDAREDAFYEKMFELMEDGNSEADATRLAREWLSTQAATHRLDGIAGGDVTDISGVGDARINSSLGSQWRNRVGDIDAAVNAYMAANPGADLSNVFMNIAFR